MLGESEHTINPTTPTPHNHPQPMLGRKRENSGGQKREQIMPKRLHWLCF